MPHGDTMEVHASRAMLYGGAQALWGRLPAVNNTATWMWAGEQGLRAAWHTGDMKVKAPHLFRASMEVFHLAEKSCTTGAASLGP